MMRLRRESPELGWAGFCFILVGLPGWQIFPFMGGLAALAGLFLLSWWIRNPSPPTSTSWILMAAAGVLGAALRFNEEAAFVMAMPTFFLSSAFLLGGIAATTGFLARDRWRSFDVFLIGVFSLMAVVLLLAQPHPFIDVFHYNQDAALRLLAGKDVYGYHADTNYGFQAWLYGYPYLPGELLLRSISQLLFRDVRVIGLVSVITAYLVAVKLGKRVTTPARARALGLVVLVGGDTFSMLTQSFTEPLLLGLLVIGAYWFHAGAPRAAGIAFGLAAATKAWLLPLPLVVLLMDRRAGKWSLGAELAVLLPFLATNPVGLVRSTILGHLALPPRIDGTTLMSIASHIGSSWPGQLGTILWLTLFLMAGLVSLGKPRYRPALDLGVATMALGCLFTLGQQGNWNYFWLLPSLAWLLVALEETPIANLQSPLHMQPTLEAS